MLLFTEQVPVLLFHVPPADAQQDCLFVDFNKLGINTAPAAATNPIKMIVITVIFASPAASFIYLTTLSLSSFYFNINYMLKQELYFHHTKHREH